MLRHPFLVCIWYWKYVTLNVVYSYKCYIMYVHPYHSSLHSLQDGCTALYMASQKGHTSVVDVLLRHGADPHVAETVSIEVVY